MISHRLGRSVILIEKGTHPRVVIGESSTPLSNLLLEELTSRYGLVSLSPLAKWGSWQRSYPNVGCGLKRGFTFHHHVLGASASPDPGRRDQLLVAASPRDEISDTHWYRADFDYLLVQEAVKLGVEYVDQVKLHRTADCGDAVRLEGYRDGNDVEFHARFVVDATGPRGFVHRALRLKESDFAGYPNTQCLYSHFRGVGRLDGSADSRTDAVPPYPIDDAAVHHVFDGGWVWVLQFNNGVTSAGVAATDELASRLGLSQGAKAWERLLDLIPALKGQFATASAERPFVHMPHMGFRSSAIVGSKWAMLPSAAGFVDPLLSTGIPLTLLGVTRLAEIIEQDWGTGRFDERLQNYAAQTDDELTATARLIRSLYANMNNFSVFVSLTLLYFAAASFSETARRLGKPNLADSFFLCENPEFGPACVRLLSRAMRPLTEQESAELTSDILEAIEPFNVAGLDRRERHNWYPMDAQDLMNAAGKLGASQSEVLELLKRSGFKSELNSVDA
jgi:FADH2 O2-dependent halogenase